ncbi:flavin reductase [Dyella jiangningensis]|uniref:flavin reductase n=1 Tax=Dyella jiangningensis TaxID=1379159 RepID=UPI001EDD0F3E|nr:flavin reductase [Dyella jiangningensis]
MRPLPQWSTIAVAPPQQDVTASLRWNHQSADVTTDHTVASLKPLSIATSLDAGDTPTLEYTDSATGKVLGVLYLAKATSIAIEGACITVYHVSGSEHRCLPWPRRSWNQWLQNRVMRKSNTSHHALMDPDSVQQLMIAYLCPRPVILVSVDARGHRNMFPMDLIGPLQRSALFSLALRNTNVSEPVMRDACKVALSSMPASMKGTVYKLAEHHKQALDDWTALPFPTRPSQAFGIPAVAAALRIRELSIVHAHDMGSHTFFLGRMASDEDLTEGAQLHHTAGFHQAYRRQRNAAFEEV